MIFISSDRKTSLIIPIVNNIYPSVSWLGFTKDELIDFGLNSKVNSNKEVESIKETITKEIDNRIKILLGNEKIAYETIYKYINFLIDNDKDIIEIFNDLDAFLKRYNYIPNKRILNRLLKENLSFFNMVKLAEKDYENLSNEEYQKRLNNSTLLQIMEAYYEITKKDLENDYNSLLLSNDISNNIRIYLKDISKFSVLTKEEEKELYNKVLEGDKIAKEKFINHNLRLVIYVARNYQNRGLSFEDLIQEGNLGLIRAVKDFDPTRGYKFSTYAWQWIRQAITRALGNDSRNIRIPIHMYEKLQDYNKTVKSLSEKLGREPTKEEISISMGLNPKQIKEIARVQNDTISLNAIVGDDENAELEHFISNNYNLEEDVINRSLRKQILASFKDANLTPREKDIILLRFGLYDGDCRTLEEVASEFNITRERIRQIEMKALRKLRNPKPAKRLLDYTDDILQSAKNVGLVVVNEEEKKNSDSNKDTNYKSLKNKNIIPGEENKRMKKKRYQSIYEYFKCDEEEVNKALARLNDYDREVFEEYKQQILSENFDYILYQKFYTGVRLRILGCLHDPNYVPRYRKSRKGSRDNSNDKITSKPQTIIKEDSPKTNTNATTISLEAIKSDSESRTSKIITDKDSSIVNSNVVREHDKFTKDDYSSMLELLRSPSFTDMMNILSAKEAVIISLRLGYVDNKYFTPKAISNFLGIDEEEVNETTKKVLLVYKDNFNNFIDRLIASTDSVKEKGKEYIKLPENKKD